MTLHTVTAHALRSGEVVFLTANGGWSGSVAEAAVAGDRESGDRLLAQAEASVQSNEIIDPYLIEVKMGSNGPLPVRYREQLRMLGPSYRRPNDKDQKLESKDGHLVSDS